MYSKFAQVILNHKKTWINLKIFSLTLYQTVGGSPTHTFESVSSRLECDVDLSFDFECICEGGDVLCLHCTCRLFKDVNPCRTLFSR